MSSMMNRIASPESDDDNLSMNSNKLPLGSIQRKSFVVIFPDKRPLEVGLIPAQSKAEDHDILKVVLILVLEKVENPLGLPASCRT